MRVGQWLVVAALAFAASCGGSSVDVAEESDGSTAPSSGQVESLEGVRSAVVRIVGTGSFADPAGGMQTNVPGSGSGFIVDPSGVVVTNNHVVTGAAKLEVFVEGEEQPRLAQLLGVSECSDLAVIQLLPAVGEESIDLPYLAWSSDEVIAGTEVYAAGYPLGDPEYTLLDGVVSKEDAAGDSSWASVRSVIEHTADTLPGMSGGPMVTPDGDVVAVNFAGNEFGQSFGIGRDVADPVVAELSSGVDVDSIGINGEAVAEGDASGVYVYSVQSGSPADVTGIRPGDFLMTVEGISVAGDGTLGDYCDVLRSHEPTAVLGVEVYRPDADELLEGQVNGRELVLAEQAAFLEFADDSGVITVTAPGDWVYNGEPTEAFSFLAAEPFSTPTLLVTADPDGWGSAAVRPFASPGVSISVMEPVGVTPDEFIDLVGNEACGEGVREPYDDGFYTGTIIRFDGCGEPGATWWVIAAQPADGSWFAVVDIITVPGQDDGFVDRIISTWAINGFPS